MQLITQPIRKNNFDLLRLLLALLVIFSHSYVIFYGTNKDIEPYMRFTNNTSDLGSAAVNWFFIISGFLITSSFKNSSSVKEYLLKRIFRIVPGFVVAFLLSIFLFGALGSIKNGDVLHNLKHYYSTVGLKKNVIPLITLQAPNGGAGYPDVPLPKLLNSPLWTIQFEFICYLFVPLAFNKFFKTRWITLLLFATAYTLLLFQKFGSFLPENPNYKAVFLEDPYYLPRFFTYFLAGACFYTFKDKIPRKFILMVLALILACFASSQGKMIHVIMPIAGPYLLFYLAFHPVFNYSKFASRGDFSYGTYLYAWPVQQLIMYYFSDNIQPITLFIFASIITVALAFLSWHLIEKRFLQLKNNFSLATFVSKAW